MTKISATIITNNDVDTIGRCIESVAPVADEIVVVDAFSTDGTVDVCRRHGCKVRQRRFDGYGAQKQYAVSLASNSYVLSIDADEYLDADLQQSIMQLKEQGLEHRIYSLSRLNFFGNRAIRHSGWWPDAQTRLFDRRYASWDLRNVHERVTFPSTLWPAPVKGLLMHNRCATAAQHRRKEASYAVLEARTLVDSGVKPSCIGAYIRAVAAFMRIYIFRLGFLDGTEGRNIASTAAAMQLVTYRMAKKAKTRIQSTVKTIESNEP